MRLNALLWAIADQAGLKASASDYSEIGHTGIARLSRKNISHGTAGKA